jgi:glutathione-specific gamma-glutamylcyclotransferase
MMQGAAPVMSLWVFGYGSLIWNPGFPVAQTVIACAEGWHRSFCMWSIHHRGTPENPGLVLALDAQEGARCHGVAFRVEPGAEDRTLAELRARELVSSAYLERVLPLSAQGQHIEALAYVIDPAHEQYARALTLDDQARIIARATGGRGPNCEYLWSTAAHLAGLGIEDPDLNDLAQRVRAIVQGG